MGKHYEVNENNLTTAEWLDAELEELMKLGKLVGKCFDSIDLDENGKLRDGITREEGRQLTDLMNFNSRITSRIRTTMKRRAGL